MLDFIFSVQDQWWDTRRFFRKSIELWERLGTVSLKTGGVWCTCVWAHPGSSWFYFYPITLQAVGRCGRGASYFWKTWLVYTFSLTRRICSNTISITSQNTSIHTHSLITGSLVHLTSSLYILLSFFFLSLLIKFHSKTTIPCGFHFLIFSPGHVCVHGQRLVTEFTYSIPEQSPPSHPPPHPTLPEPPILTHKFCMKVPSSAYLFILWLLNCTIITTRGLLPLCFLFSFPISDLTLAWRRVSSFRELSFYWFSFAVFWDWIRLWVLFICCCCFF